jgi:hypothetical protein
MRLRKVCLATFLLLACALLHGCPIFPSYGHPDVLPPVLEQTDEDPNTFRIAVPRVFRKQEDWVKAIRVTDWKEANKGNILVCWEIRATERVSMHGFQVEVGRVPSRFEQVVPEAGARFSPEPGKSYYIAVSLENFPTHEWLTTSFKGGCQEPNWEDWKPLLKNRTNNGKH